MESFVSSLFIPKLKPSQIRVKASGSQFESNFEQKHPSSPEASEVKLDQVFRTDNVSVHIQPLLKRV